MRIEYVLFITMIVYRLIAGIMAPEYPFLMGFTPIAALALCGPMIFPKRTALWLPLSILLASDVILNGYYGAGLVSGYLFPRYLALALIAVLGFRLCSSRKAGSVLAATFAASCGFYLTTNTASWWFDPDYVKTFAGWFQALTTGVPGFPPTWMFFRNALVSDLIFSAVFLLCLAPNSKPCAQIPSATFKKGKTLYNESLPSSLS